MEFATLRRARALTPEEATAVVGDPVEPLPANVHQATVVVDADTGAPALAYLPLPDVATLRRAVLTLPRPQRSRGKMQAQTFGYSRRRPAYQREGCSVSALGRDDPAAHRAVVGYAGQLRSVLAEVAPGIVARAHETMSQVDADWKLGESDLWTSGVINTSARLPYHRDAMNFPVWSAMPVLRRNMTGGHLSVPEYDLVLPCRDGWGVFFPGYQLVHGVTPMATTKPDGYRYSLVYYALRGMQDCFSYAVEQEYAKKRRTAREKEIARKLADGETPTALDSGMPPGRTGAYAREMPGYQDTARQLAERNRPGKP